ncbi:hypothetical protein FRC00_000186 [Tulasnella sp. 408]|nr:hypothetical protein FRC00_000186 [Tulasnella sp. 408]
MREMLQTGKPIHCYVSFDPDTQLFQSARWSFHPHPPSEEEAAAEVNVLEAFKCPELWAHPRPWTDINYWQLEDEDFEFFSKISGDNEETARIEVLEEPSGSSSLKT